MNMNTLFRSSEGRHSLFTRTIAGVVAMALEVSPLVPAFAAPGGVTNNSGLIPFDQAYFAFEVENVLSTMKEVPIWDELEQMLNNPYTMRADPSMAPNYQGWNSVRSTQERRRSFIYRNSSGQPCAPGTPNCTEVPLPGHVVHPLNYNHMNGEELRLLNPGFGGLQGWKIPDQLVLVEASNTDSTKGPLGVGRYEYTYKTINVSPGADRVEEVSPNFNSPIAPDFPLDASGKPDLTKPICIVTTEPPVLPGPGPFKPAPGGPVGALVDMEGNPQTLVPEGSIICGGDPGDPGYAGFGTLLADASSQYSTPAFPLPDSVAAGSRRPGFDITLLPGFGTGTARLYDPAGCDERNQVSPGSCDNGYINWLLRPSLRPTPTGTLPNYVANSADADPEELLPSNENDYYRGNDRTQKKAARLAAAALGKALFWDMQVGSDGIQSCGSCHFHAGVDNRSKNQLNPNHLGGDFKLQIGDTGPVGDRAPNYQLKVTDFPFHKLANVQESGECASHGDGIVNNNCGNVQRHSNDVASSMGVLFSPFTDIPTPGPAAFGPASPVGTVRPLQPDLRTMGPAAADPIPAFQGFRRVEPRNTPTLFGATLNFDNFWDGRARHDFNGGSVFGPADPQAHVMVNDGGTIVPTRQIIRFASLASLATGPALSEFEMSFAGRNWQKLGKKLLQANVTPLANQLVAANDSVLGPYSNNRAGAAPGCAGLPAGDLSPGTPAVGKPGLCLSYSGLIKLAYYDALWSNTSQHLDGCYTNLPPPANPSDTRPRCAAKGVDVAIPVLASGSVEDSTNDPFDGYVLTVANGAAAAGNTDQFTQMEANMPLFFGLSVHAWTTLLMPDDTPMDRFYDANPDAYVSFGEANSQFLVLDLLTCGQPGHQAGTPCVTEVGNFKRDATGLFATLDCTTENCAEGRRVAVTGTRQPSDPDPLMGMDFFLGSNLSLKNPNFRTLRCGECHQGGTLTDHTVEVSHQWSFNDWLQEFTTGQPGSELFPEPLGRSRVITGFALEGEISESAQDAIERNMADLCTVEPCVDAHGNSVPGGRVGGFPQGQALFDNGVYNIGVTPIANDVSRGGPDAFGWPLSLSYLALKNLCGIGYTPGGDDPTDGFRQPGYLGGPGTPGVGFPCPNFDPDADFTGGGLFNTTAQDQQINPGFTEEPADPQLPAYLAKWASNLIVGDETQQDEVFVGVNTLSREPITEGFIDNFGPFNPAAVVGETFSMASQMQMSTWPNVNRVNAQGAFKAPPLRNIALMGPYFHNGGKLTLMQVLDFYLRGGDFPKTNAQHRDFLIAHLRTEDEALGFDAATNTSFTDAQKEKIIESVVDFLLELTDERVAFERAPFDHPEIFVPLDGKAPDNTFGRSGLIARTSGVCAGPGSGPCFRQVAATGMGGLSTPLPNFLGVTNIRPGKPGFNCNPASGPISHYCH